MSIFSKIVITALVLLSPPMAIICAISLIAYHIKRYRKRNRGDSFE